MHRFRNFMVALDRTSADAGLIRYATSIARLGTASEVRFVHVLPRSDPSGTVLAHDAAAAGIQSAVQTHSAGMPAGVRLTFEVLAGPLTDVLLCHAAEEHIDLLFLGHRSGTPGRKPLARRLAMKAPCSVWMAPQDSQAPPSRILVPIDFSEHSSDSLLVAASLARLCGLAECVALHVYFNRAVATFEEYGQLLRGREEETCRRFIAPLNLQGVTVTPVFEESADVPSAIARVAERCGADLIVMATRGRSRSSAILLGSVTEEMILRTRVPLLAVKHFGARLEVLQALLDRRFRQRGDLRTD